MVCGSDPRIYKSNSEITAKIIVNELEKLLISNPNECKKQCALYISTTNIPYIKEAVYNFQDKLNQ